MKKYFRFTKQFIVDVTTDKKRERFYDTGADGLVLSVTKAGNKSYYVKFWRADNKEGSAHVERVIGQAKDMTVDEARRLVRELKSEMVVTDPRLEKSREVVKEYCLEDFHQVWLKDIEHELRVGKASEKYVFNKRRMWEIHMPVELARKRIGDVTLDEMIAVFQEVREESLSVHTKLVKHTKSLYKIGRERLNLDVGNPLVRYKVDEDLIRERFLSPDEMPVFMAAVREERQIFQDVILSLLLTAQRKAAVLSMRWQDVDLVGETWRVPKEKMKGRLNGFVVPIPDALVDILKRRREASSADDVYVFPSQGRNKGQGHVSGNGGNGSWWSRIRARSGITDVCLHDLRRTMGSWLAVGGVDIYKISKVLAHKDVRVTQRVYAHLQAVDARGDLNRVGGMMLGSVEKKAAVDIESLAANLSGEDKMRMISVLARSMT